MLFWGIKSKLLSTFYPSIDSQSKRQNYIIEVYFYIVVNFEQNNWAKLFSIAQFIYNNTKNAGTGYTPFELNTGYHFCISYKKDIDPCSKSKPTDHLANDLRELITICWENLQHA